MFGKLFKNWLFKFRTQAFGWKMPYDCDPQEELTYINSLKEPSDDLERSYAQYRCQCHLMGASSVFVYNVGCFFIMLPFIIKCLLGRVNEKIHADIVFTISIKDKSIIPSSLHNKYETERITDVYEGFLLKSGDWKYIKALFGRYPFSYYFVLRMIFKMAIYRFFIEKYSPKAIAINGEYSSTSSFMTYYCESQGIEHINVMHGEKLLYIRDSFFRFTKCYVWDEYYIGLFTKERAAAGQFVVERPDSLHFDISQHKGSIPHCDFKYMLFENEKLEDVCRTMQQLMRKGYSIKLRPHPSYTDRDKLKKLVDLEDIEDPKIPIADSVCNTDVVISLNSTVLLQAQFSGIEIAIDDYNSVYAYQKMKDLEYILVNKPHKRLSEILEYDKKNN